MLFPGEKTTHEVSLVVKSNHQTSIHRIFSPLTRPFGREVFWYSIAYPELAKIYPEVASISPGKTLLLFEFKVFILVKIFNIKITENYQLR
jgi:hypothetical protein